VLIALSTIDQLRLLKRMFEGKRIVIPQAVLREVVEEGRGQPGAKEVEREDGRFRIGPELYRRALREVGEAVV
jgi:hypothetical protein